MISLHDIKRARANVSNQDETVSAGKKVPMPNVAHVDVLVKHVNHNRKDELDTLIHYLRNARRPQTS